MTTRASSGSSADRSCAGSRAFEIVEVANFGVESERLVACSIDSPRLGPQRRPLSWTFEGWVVGRDSPAVAVEFLADDFSVRRTPVWVARPDVATQISEGVGMPVCGFQTTFSLLGVPKEFDIRADAVLADDTRIPLAVVRGRHGPINTGFRPSIRPLLVTSMGRTGSTWLMRVLLEHPAIAVYRAYPYETRIAGYWISLLKNLVEPANPFDIMSRPALAGIAHTGEYNPMFFVGHNPYFSETGADYSDVRTWLEGGYVERQAGFCQEQVEEFYQRIGRSQRQPRPKFFAEKFSASEAPWMVWKIYPELKEIFLIRDLRDVICSMIEFSAKRGSDGFIREAGGPDAWVRLAFQQGALALLHQWQRRADSSILIKYEDLIRSPEATITRALRYLGLRATPAVVAGMLSRASAPMAALADHKTSPDVPSSIGRWRRDLSPALRAISREYLSDVLRGFGYEDDV